MKRVLLCGDDQSLLTVRAAVLRTVPGEVETRSGLAELMTVGSAGHPDLFVLCNSMSFQDRVFAAAWIGEAFPAVPVITLLRSDDRATGAFEHPLSPVDGPAGLVSLSKALTQ
jgi:hypothetical protein